MLLELILVEIMTQPLKNCKQNITRMPFHYYYCYWVVGIALPWQHLWWRWVPWILQRFNMQMFCFSRTYYDTMFLYVRIYMCHREHCLPQHQRRPWLLQLRRYLVRRLSANHQTESGGNDGGIIFRRAGLRNFPWNSKESVLLKLKYDIMMHET